MCFFFFLTSSSPSISCKLEGLIGFKLNILGKKISLMTLLLLLLHIKKQNIRLPTITEFKSDPLVKLVSRAFSTVKVLFFLFADG